MFCKLCDKETEGSRGPATGYLRPICSDCAAQEDGSLETLVRQSIQMETVFDSLFPRVVQELGEIA